MAPNKKKFPEDDVRLLEQAFRDVERLPGRKIKKKSAAQPKPKSGGTSAKNYRPTHKGVDTELRPAPKLPDLAHGETPGLDKRSAQRLKRGQMKIEAKLDLHGHRQEEAHRALNRFLAGAQESGKRCVLVVTGKGFKGEGPKYMEGGSQVGVLKENVPRWLNQAPNRARVLSFSFATQADGGSGALYILLKRLR